MTKIRQRKAAGAVKKPEIKFGKVEDIILTGVRLDDSIVASKKHIYLTFSQLGKDGEYIAESTFSWFKINPSSFSGTKKPLSEEIMSAVRDLAVQLHGLLACYLGEDEAFKALEDDFKPVEYDTIEDMVSAKWGKKHASAAEDNLKGLFLAAVTPFIGDKSEPIRIKVLPNKQGTHKNLPKYGVFCERMDVDESGLVFTNYEKNVMSNLAMTGDEKSALKYNNEQSM